MAKTTKAKAVVVVTRAEKKDATKSLIKEVLAVKPLKHNELLDEVAKLYTERFGGEETENVNDVKGRVGSVLDIMKKDGDVMQDGGVYALKARMAEMPAAPVEETPKKGKARTKKGSAEPVVTEESTVKAEEKPAKKTAKKSKKTEEKPVETAPAEENKPTKKAKAKKEKAEPLPAAPIQPIAPVAPVTPEAAPEPIPEKEEKPKKGKARAKKTEEKAETATPAEAVKEEKPAVAEVKTEIKNPPAIKEKGEIVKPPVVMDMSFLFGGVKPSKTTEKPVEQPVPKTEVKAEQKTENKPTPKAEAKPAQTEKKGLQLRKDIRTVKAVKPNKPLTAEERLKESFLKKLRALGGDYFEYYSVYLLERYSMRNGRRLEGLRISGGGHDGGIDGELEVTDRLGFRETIYIQAKNWDPDKGDERLWVVGETLLQQFIGACACKQAKDRKQHSRGIFVTTSRFTPEAKRILEDMSDKIVGYDGNDLFDAAKECEFGLVKKNGEWVLDEKLLSGEKAFFHMM